MNPSLRIVRIAGEPTLFRRLDTAAKRLGKGLPSGRKAASETMQTRLYKRFSTGGASSGPRWVPIAPRTLKGRKVNKSPDPPLTDRGDLWEDYGTAHLEGQAVFFETDRVDAASHNFGNPEGNEPAREFAFLDDSDTAAIRSDYANAAWEALGYS